MIFNIETQVCQLSILNDFISWDPYVMFLAILVCFTMTFILYGSLNYVKIHSRPLVEYPIILFLIGFFLFVLVSSLDVLISFIGLVGFSLNVYSLILNDSFNQSSREAAIKYYYLSAFSSGLIAFGVWLLYLLFLNTNFIDISWILHVCAFQEHQSLLNIMLYFILFGFFFKLAAVPCHLWAASVYEASPQPITALFILPIKIAVLGFFFKLLGFVFRDLYMLWSFVIWFSSVSSMLVGSLSAVVEKKTKKFIAYSSINQMGFLLLGLSCGNVGSTRSSVIYLLIYILMNVGLFVVLLNTYENSTYRQMTFLTDFHFFAKNNWSTSVTLIIIFFSMAGIPPLAGFFGKYYLFIDAFLTKYYSLVFVGMLTSVISTFYYLKIIKFMWFDKQKIGVKFIAKLTMGQLVLLSLVETTLILFFLWSNSFFFVLDFIVFYCLTTD